MKNINKLVNMGFRCVGQWELKNENPIYILKEAANLKDILYAFVCDKEILYIGKSVQTLNKRLYGYRNPGPSQTTNQKGNKAIKELLSVGKNIEIYILPDDGLLSYGGFHVNLMAGLEDSLIAGIKPKWNKTGKNS
ncbi:GIY-YIG nuclease family protein [bacterium]|nr:GIY-YIG nuclease family protein [bacterium]